ncbi:hypothetical protein AAY473_033440 [Plecturocebus cupreus]
MGVRARRPGRPAARQEGGWAAAPPPRAGARAAGRAACSARRSPSPPSLSHSPLGAQPRAGAAPGGAGSGRRGDRALAAHPAGPAWRPRVPRGNAIPSAQEERTGGRRAGGEGEREREEKSSRAAWLRSLAAPGARSKGDHVSCLEERPLWDPPASASQSVGIAGVNHRSRPLSELVAPPNSLKLPTSPVGEVPKQPHFPDEEVRQRVCASCGCWDKRPKPRGLKQCTSILLQFWRPEVQSQGARVSCWEEGVGSWAASVHLPPRVAVAELRCGPRGSGSRSPCHHSMSLEGGSLTVGLAMGQGMPGRRKSAAPASRREGKGSMGDCLAYAKVQHDQYSFVGRARAQVTWTLLGGRSPACWRPRLWNLRGGRG